MCTNSLRTKNAHVKDFVNKQPHDVARGVFYGFKSILPTIPNQACHYTFPINRPGSASNPKVLIGERSEAYRAVLQPFVLSASNTLRAQLLGFLNPKT